MSIKSCFRSRWDGGYLVDVDFSQLEVVALAILSNDTQLKEDILSGKDMHTVRAAELFSIPEAMVTPAQRQLCKALSFQLQYGAGWKSMSEKNGISGQRAKDFIYNYYARYPQVREWQDDVAYTVKGSRRVTGKHTPKGVPMGEGVYESITGRVYKFNEYDSSFKDDASFSPTEMKNYPVQGFATGDIMALYRGRVYRKLLSLRNDDIKLINTVHDSVMLDVQSKGLVEYVYREVMKPEADRLPELLKDLWDIDCDIPFKVECKYGPTWAEMTKL